MAAERTIRVAVRRGRLALVVLLAAAAVTLPRELVWCSTPAGHGSLENLLLGHCSASRTGHCDVPAPSSEQAAAQVPGHQGCHTHCTDIPVSHPAANDTPGDPVALSQRSGNPRPSNPEWDAQVPAVAEGPPLGQIVSCLAATVLLR